MGQQPQDHPHAETEAQVKPHVCLLMLVALCPLLHPQAGGSGTACAFSFPFSGEKAQYLLTFKGIGAAEASIQYIPGGQGRIQARIDTKALTSLIFSIHNIYETDVDLATGLPTAVRKEIAQSNITQSLQIHYDRPANTAKTGGGATWTIQPGAMDLFTMLYQLRLASPKPDEKISFPLDIESQKWIANGEATAGGEMKGPQGRVDTRKIILHFSSGDAAASRSWKTDLLTNRIARPDGQLTIFLGPPPDNIPMMLQFGPAGQQVTMRLKRYEKGKN
jgi:hypothetical protein